MPLTHALGMIIVPGFCFFLKTPAFVLLLLCLRSVSHGVRCTTRAVVARDGLVSDTSFSFDPNSDLSLFVVSAVSSRQEALLSPDLSWLACCKCQPWVSRTVCPHSPRPPVQHPRDRRQSKRTNIFLSVSSVIFALLLLLHGLA